MNIEKMRKQISAARRCAGVEMVLNYYTYYEMLQEGNGVFCGRLPALEKEYHRLLKAFLEDQGKETVDPGLEALREETIHAMEGACAYADEMQLYEYAFNRMEHRFLPEIRDRKEAGNEEQWTREILSYITQAEETFLMNERIRSVMGELPVRLTKNKFFSLVDRGLSLYKGREKSAFSAALYMLRSDTMMIRPEGMEQDCGELEALLKELEAADLKNLTEGEYRRLSGILGQGGVLLEEYTGRLSLFMDLVNELYLMELARGMAVTEALEEEQIREMLSCLAALFEEGAVRPIPREVTDGLPLLEGRQEVYLEQWEKMDDGREAEGESFSDTWEKVKLLMSDSSFVSFRKEEKEEKIVDDAVYSEELERLFQDWTAFFTGKPKAIVRAAMAAALSHLPMFFESIDEIGEYIRGSFESCTDQVEKETSMELLRMMIQEETMWEI